MRLTPVTVVTDLPFSLADAKAELRVTHAHDDAKIQAYVDAALSRLSGRYGVLGRILGTQTWDYAIDRFPDGAIALPFPPLQSVVSVTYVDSASATQTLAASAYRVNAADDPGRITPVTSWPATASVPGAVTVRFVAGYGANVPASLKVALRLIVRDLYDETHECDEAISRLAFTHMVVRP